MVRTTLSGCALALLLGACSEPKGVEIDARNLLPGVADFVFGGELEPVKNSPIGPLLYAAASSDADFKTMLDVVPKCSVDLTNLRVVFAGMSTDDEKFVAVVESPGIGTEKSVSCIETEYAKALGKPTGLLAFKTRGDVRTLAQQGGGVLVILNKNTVATASAAWEPALYDAIEKPEARDRTSAMSQAVQRIDPATDMWLALTVNDAQRADMADMKGFDGAVLLSATGDLSTGLKVAVAIDTTSAAKAAEIKATIDETLAATKGQQLPPGVPANLLDGITATTSDARVTMQFALPADGLVTTLMAMAPLFADE